MAGVLLSGKQLQPLGQAGAALGPFYTGIYIMTLLLGMGGPTGESSTHFTLGLQTNLLLPASTLSIDWP